MSETQSDLVRCILEILWVYPCPECHMSCQRGGLHGVSQVHGGEPCHLGALLNGLSADDAAAMLPSSRHWTRTI